jgi:hypothetical protein
MSEQRPEPGVEYAAYPTEEYRAHCDLEAARSLGKFLRIPATEARAMLGAGSAGPAIRSRRADPVLARRLLEKRLPDPSLLRFP